jgi:hypothetical protein
MQHPPLIIAVRILNHGKARTGFDARLSDKRCRTAVFAVFAHSGANHATLSVIEWWPEHYVMSDFKTTALAHVYGAFKDGV